MVESGCRTVKPGHVNVCLTSWLFLRCADVAQHPSQEWQELSIEVGGPSMRWHTFLRLCKPALFAYVFSVLLGQSRAGQACLAGCCFGQLVLWTVGLPSGRCLTALGQGSASQTAINTCNHLLVGQASAATGSAELT